MSGTESQIEISIPDPQDNPDNEGKDSKDDGDLMEVDEEDEDEDDEEDSNFPPLETNLDQLPRFSKPVEKYITKKAFQYFTKRGNPTEIPTKYVLRLLRGLNKNPHPGQIDTWLRELKVEENLCRNHFLLIMKQPNLADVDNELAIREAFRTFDPKETGFIPEDKMRTILEEIGDDLLKKQDIDDFLKQTVDPETRLINYYETSKMMLSNVKPLVKEKKKRRKKKN